MRTGIGLSLTQADFRRQTTRLLFLQDRGDLFFQKAALTPDVRLLNGTYIRPDTFVGPDHLLSVER